jgi:hypothetical protein
MFTVSWPAPSDGFSLEATSDLAAVSAWQTITNPVLDTNGVISVSLPATAARQFHRLRQ